MFFRQLMTGVVVLAALAGCGTVPAVPGAAVANGNAAAAAKRPSSQVNGGDAVLLDYEIRSVRAANGVTHQVQLVYVTDYTTAQKADFVARDLRADCINRGSELDLQKLTLVNSYASYTANGKVKAMPENHGLTLIAGGKLVTGPAPSALALDTELKNVGRRMAQGDLFLGTNTKPGKGPAKGEELRILTAFVKAAQKALAGR